MLIAGVTATGASVVFQADAQTVERDVSHLRVGIGGAGGAKAAVAVSGAATLNKQSGVITSEALTTAAAAEYTLVITNAEALATDLPVVSIQQGSSTTGAPMVRTVTMANGSITIIVRNIHASAALNGTLKISFILFRI